MSVALPSLDAVPRLDEVDELREQVLRSITVALALTAMTVLWLIVFQPKRWGLEPLLVVMALLAAAGAAYWLLSRGLLLSASAVLIGIVGTITIAVWSLGNGLFAFAYPVAALIAGALFGWRAAVAVGSATSLLILSLAASLPAALPPDLVEALLFVNGVNVALAWLLARPLTIALGWVWASYNQALERTEEARARQAELASLSTSLEQACARLETVNAELERARKAAVEARRHKAEFASTISHELRTPLNLIIGFSEMMALAPRVYGRDPLPEAYRGDVEAIYRNACHLSSLIDDVLELSQVDANRLGFTKQTVDLHDIVVGAIGAIGDLVEERGIGLTIDLPSNLPLLNVDPTRIRQVLINLLSNAARFTTKGEIRVGAVIQEGEVVVSVSDTGPGIPPDEVDRVFEEFHRIEGGERQHHSGLGLTISKRLIELHGGSIWVESALGRGTTFHFSLPTCENVIATAPSAWETWAVVVGSPGPAVLVIAEDQNEIGLFRRFLDRYRVLGATKATEVLSIIDQVPPEALVAVGPAGQAELARLLQENASIRDLPTITCSLKTFRSIGQQLGASNYLVKPVTRERLGEALAQIAPGARRVLVVDDEPEMVRLLSRMVSTQLDRCEVQGVTSGITALEAMRGSPPDIVLLDLLMPDLDGYEVLRTMREDERLRDVPVVIVSARGLEEDSVTAERLEIARPGGLSIGELMGSLKASLDLLISAPQPAPALPAG